MKIVTAANIKYKEIVKDLLTTLKQFNYDYLVYDLGGLGIGIPYKELDESFQKNGYYNILDGYWKTRAIFKPKIIKHTFKNNNNELLIWMDADTLLKKSLINMEENYDVGLVVRKEFKWMSCSPRSNQRMGRYNAGVLFFNPTDKTEMFVDEWLKTTLRVENDQMALNMILNKYIKFHHNDILPKLSLPFNLKEFPYIYNDENCNEDTIIHHLKGNKKLNK